MLPGTVRRHVAGFILPILILGLAQLAAPLAGMLPASLEGVPELAPLWMLVLSGALALVFNRGRIVVAVACPALAYAAFQLGLLNRPEEFAGRTAFAALCVLIPLDLAVLAQMRERGLFNFYGMRRLGLLVLQVLLTAWVIVRALTQVTDWLYFPLLEPPPFDTQVPQIGLAITALGLIAIVVHAVRRRSALDAGIAGALVAFAMACQTIGRPHHFVVFIGAAAAALVAAILQDTFRMAFRDELTGLPSRRALNERLLALGANYTIAMVDVDHFKSFNDSYGHELGDHVLRMVAAKLETIGAGGRAYRYGGEEFAVLFPGKRIPAAWPQLEALRKRIAAHPIVLRSEAQPVFARSGTPSAGNERRRVSVTVSIGVAERNARHLTAGEVLRAADRALYRAKERGRDRVSL